MEYFIGFMLKDGALARYQQVLATLLSERYQVISPLAKGTPPHITLQSPFFIDDVSGVATTIRSFTSTHNKFSFTVESFGHFGSSVIFLEPSFDNVGSTVLAEFGVVLQANKDIHIRETDLHPHFHLTIAKNTTDYFDDIWTLVSHEPKPLFRELFDNITLFEKREGKWTVKEVFPLLEL